jgi:RNA polymerase sporulation-specific sigma factor
MEELRQQTGLTQEELLLAIEASQEVDSISKPIRREDGNMHTMEEHLESPERFEGALLERLAVRQVIDELDEPEQRLIRLRYMQGCTQTETAERMGTNQVAVSRMERRILGKLRRRLE